MRALSTDSLGRKQIVEDVTHAIQGMISDARNGEPDALMGFELLKESPLSSYILGTAARPARSNGTENRYKESDSTISCYPTLRGKESEAVRKGKVS